MSDIGFAASFIGGLLLLLLVVFGGVGAGIYYTEKSSCYAFGREANREVRFVKFNLVSWDCLTPTKDGRWISTSRLRDID